MVNDTLACAVGRTQRSHTKCSDYSDAFFWSS